VLDQGKSDIISITKVVRRIDGGLRTGLTMKHDLRVGRGKKKLVSSRRSIVACKKGQLQKNREEKIKALLSVLCERGAGSGGEEGPRSHSLRLSIQRK